MDLEASSLTRRVSGLGGGGAGGRRAAMLSTGTEEKRRGGGRVIEITSPFLSLLRFFSRPFDRASA
jgi:hypothetical protein